VELNEKVTFRCSTAEKRRLEERSEGNLSHYCRDLVLRRMDNEDAFSQILQRLDRLQRNTSQQGQAAPSDQSLTTSILLELLLMLRATVTPDTRKSAQAELARHGLTAWSYETHQAGKQGDR